MPNAQDRALIGITASRQTMDTSVGPIPFFVQSTFYAEAVLAAGGIPLILPPSQAWHPEILDVIGGLIVSGGEDVEPGRYGQIPPLDRRCAVASGNALRASCRTPAAI